MAMLLIIMKSVIHGNKIWMKIHQKKLTKNLKKNLLLINPRRFFVAYCYISHFELFDIHVGFKNYEVESLNRKSGEVKLM